MELPLSPRASGLYPPDALPKPPRRSRLTGILRAIIIGGAVFLVASLADTKDSGPSASAHRGFVEIPVVGPAGVAGAMPGDVAEKYASAVEVRKDTNGTYVESGQADARAFGATLTWADWDVPSPSSGCGHDADEVRKPLAWFCDAEPYLVRLNRCSSSMPATLYERHLVATVKHELSHLVIHQRCGRSKPAERTVELEGVTNSYAVTSDIDEVASWIHAGVCWYQPSSAS